MQDAVVLRIRCSKCYQTFEPGGLGFSRRTSPIQPGVTEIGIVCSHCGVWTHIAYTNAEIQALERLVSQGMEDRVELFRVRRELGQKFTELQAQCESKESKNAV